jgi:hypothetical protein
VPSPARLVGWRLLVEVVEPHLEPGEDLGELKVALFTAGGTLQLEAQLVGDLAQPLGEPGRLVAVQQPKCRPSRAIASRTAYRSASSSTAAASRSSSARNAQRARTTGS